MAAPLRPDKRQHGESAPMTIVVAGWSRIPAILNFPDTAGFAETCGFGAASGRVWLESQYLASDISKWQRS